jgi:holo-[acyl-carrier protein] synthase
VGIDVVDIDRFRDIIERTPTMSPRLFTVGERAYAGTAKDPAERLAVRFAAKEAFSKAVGTGFKRGVFMKDIGVVNAPSGAPTLALTGGAAARLAALTPEGHEAVVHLTLTDDHPWAQAFVVIEARPR